MGIASGHGYDLAAVIIAVLLLAWVSVWLARASRPRRPGGTEARSPRGATGAAPQQPRSARPRVGAAVPYRDYYTPDRVELVSDLRDAPLERVARGYGLTLAAARRFRDRYEEARTCGSGSARGYRAATECDDILDNPDNRRRWH